MNHTAVSHPSPSTHAAEAHPNTPPDTPPMESYTDEPLHAWVQEILDRLDPNSPLEPELIAIGVLELHSSDIVARMKLAERVLNGQFVSAEHMAGSLSVDEIAVLEASPKRGQLVSVIKAREKWDEALDRVAKQFAREHKIDLDDPSAPAEARQRVMALMVDRFQLIQHLRESIVNPNINAAEPLSWLLRLVEKYGFAQRAVDYWGGNAERVITGELSKQDLAKKIPRDLRSEVGCRVGFSNKAPTSTPRKWSPWNRRI